MAGPELDNEWTTVAKVGSFCASVALIYMAVRFWPEVLSFLP